MVRTSLATLKGRQEGNIGILVWALGRWQTGFRHWWVPRTSHWSKMGNTDANFYFRFNQPRFHTKISPWVYLLMAALGCYLQHHQSKNGGAAHPGTVNQYRDDAKGIASYIAPGLVGVEGSASYDADGHIIEDTYAVCTNSTPVNYIDWKQKYLECFLYTLPYYDQSFAVERSNAYLQCARARFWAKRFSKSQHWFVGRNLLLWADMPNVDPDTGRDNLQTPSTRNVGL